MRRRVTFFAFLLAAMLAAFTGGAVIACSGNYCAPFDTSDCVTLDEFADDSCCIDQGGGVSRCMTCSREAFMCLVDADIEQTWGQGFNCRNPGAVCQ
jgi:hypothetical protein